MTSAAQQAEAMGEALNGGQVLGKRRPGSWLIDLYVSLVHRPVTRDARVYSDFLLILNLLDAPGLLLHPVNVFRVIRANLRS